MQQTRQRMRKISWVVLVILILSAVVGIYLAITPKVHQMNDYQARSDALQQKINETVLRERALKEKQRRFVSDPTFVERVAHEVGYAHTNELIFQFEPSASGHGTP